MKNAGPLFNSMYVPFMWKLDIRHLIAQSNNLLLSLQQTWSLLKWGEMYLEIISWQVCILNFRLIIWMDRLMLSSKTSWHSSPLLNVTYIRESWLNIGYMFVQNSTKEFSNWLFSIKYLYYYKVLSCF